MTRKNFLESEWKKYPVFSAAAPPIQDDSWVMGRVQSVSATAIDVMGESLSITSKTGIADAALGIAAPLAALRAGDIVAYSKNLECVFLLAPDLKNTEIPSTVEWQMFLQVVHDFFAGQGFIHWLTPSFVASSGVDANIDFFVAQGVRTGRQFRLPTSPEFELKKAMVEGVERLYEIKKCYRDDDASPIHKTEFTMLEWYRGYAKIDEVEADVLALVNYLIETFGFAYDTFEPFKHFTMAQLFKTYLDFDLTPTTSAAQLKELLDRDGIDWTDADDWNDLFFRAYVDQIEPQLAALGSIIVNGFPAQQRSLARLTPEGWADRFEFYWSGIEIANAYHEENNPEVIEQIVEKEMIKREKAGKPAITKDSAFLEMVQSGFPPSAGIALGLDRLYMCLKGQSEL